MQLTVKPLIRTCLALAWAALAVLLAAPRAHADTKDGDPVRQDVSFRGGGGLVLHGTVLTRPDTPGTRPGTRPTTSPGIVLIGGSGPGPRDEYRQEAETFARAGITTLVFDKRTVGYSTTHHDYDLLADDALAGVRLLRERKDVDPHLVGLWGFSEGGWVAPLAAARSSDVAFLITLGGSGYAPLRTQAWNLGTHLQHRGVDGSFRGVVAGPAAQLMDSTGLFPAADHDPRPVLNRLHHIPVLALWGAYDNQIPPRESARIFRESLDRAGNRHAVIGFVPGAAHNGHRTTDGFDRIGGPLFHGRPLGELTPGYARTMTSWVRAVAAGHPPESRTAPAPPQAMSSVPVPGRTWWAWLLPALLCVGFAAYPLSAVLRRGPAVRPVRWLSGLGLLTVVGAVQCPLAVYVAGDGAAAPVLWGRPLAWLAVQTLAVAVLVTAGVTVATVLRRHRTWSRAAWLRIAPAALATIGFVPWAVWWGVLRP
ncbi:alpha/beta hydrolase family protein [Streptomyces noursei]|uniref:alpha/beta hydrolase family protein n=1 Tax=Streptomyces noursei TaxID=1971 RepID=UPI00196593DF|nr:prolyl oligopeptidase family serine peptidase [Streptomyces noursei]QRX90416.1 prolyl oligopeptidase family serine peptidase [Streptomyces noursei]